MVEEWIDGEEGKSPCVQLRADPLHEVEVLSTHKQLLGGTTGTTFPAVAPGRTPFVEPLTRYGRDIAAQLARHGVIGRFGLDFVFARKSEMWQPYAIEVNLRTVAAALAVLGRRRRAVTGTSVLFAASLLSAVSGFFDGQFARADLSGVHVALQVGLIGTATVVAALAGLRLRELLAGRCQWPVDSARCSASGLAELNRHIDGAEPTGPAPAAPAAAQVKPGEWTRYGDFASSSVRRPSPSVSVDRADTYGLAGAMPTDVHRFTDLTSDAAPAVALWGAGAPPARNGALQRLHRRAAPDDRW